MTKQTVFCQKEWIYIAISETVCLSELTTVGGLMTSPIICRQHINSLPNNKILGWSKFKNKFADHEINVNEKLIFF